MHSLLCFGFELGSSYNLTIVDVFCFNKVTSELCVKGKPPLLECTGLKDFWV